MRSDAWSDERGGAPPSAHTARANRGPVFSRLPGRVRLALGGHSAWGRSGTCSRGQGTRSPSPSASWGPRKAHTSCVPGPGGGARLCTRPGAGQQQRPWGEAGTSHPPAFHQSPDRCSPGSPPGGLSRPQHSSQRLADGKPTAHWAEQGRTRQLEPSDAPGKPRPSRPQPAPSKRSLRLAARPAVITPASEKSRAVCGDPDTMEWPRPRTTQAGAHTWLHPQQPQDISVPQNL